MKKRLLSKGDSSYALSWRNVAILALPILSLLPSCSDKDEPDVKPDDQKPGQEVAASHGAYVLNQGQYNYGVEGSLTFIDYAGGFPVINNAFQTVNKRSLGDTPQCGVRYGNKIYLGICDSNTIEIIDGESFKSLKQISLDPAATGGSPRGMAVDKGKVYISMFDGHVARLDTASMNIDACVKVGPNPEIPAVFNNKLFVPNSDGMNHAIGYGTTASIINLDSFTVESTVEVPLNPERFITAGGNLYLLSRGDYGAVAGALYEIDPQIATIQKTDPDSGYKEIVKATHACAQGSEIIYFNAPYDKPEREYGKYEVSTGKFTKWDAKEVIYPNAIAVDPSLGYIFVASYIMDGPYPSYMLPGFVVMYDKDFSFIKKFDVGSGPSCIFFQQGKAK